MGEINVFNTFSFKKWSDRLKEQKIEEEVQKQRMEQVSKSSRCSRIVHISLYRRWPGCEIN
jgi:hypothetical protein